jgi:hypothetical protein
MKIFLVIIIFSSSLIIFSQTERHEYAPPDSLNKIKNVNDILPANIKPDLFIPLSAANYFSLSIKLGLNPFSPLTENNYELNNDLYFSQSLLKEQFKSSFLYTMLGAVQTGAIGYMAYKHIKKFGLFK